MIRVELLMRKKKNFELFFGRSKIDKKYIKRWSKKWLL